MNWTINFDIIETECPPEHAAAWWGAMGMIGVMYSGVKYQVRNADVRSADGERMVHDGDYRMDHSDFTGVGGAGGGSDPEPMQDVSQGGRDGTRISGIQRRTESG